MFPDETTTEAVPSKVTKSCTYWARDLYPKHLEFFAAGAAYRERCFMAANRVGKTVGGGYETSCHLTGLYPDWWTGKRFNGPVDAWAAGKTNTTTRDIVQFTLFGETKRGMGEQRYLAGNGLVPGEHIIGHGTTWRSGVTDLVDIVQVRHVPSGGVSRLTLKSYEQGRGAFEGTAREVIWLDEECPRDIWDECVIRTATTNGTLMLTFTPLDGLTKTVLEFLPDMKTEKD